MENFGQKVTKVQKEADSTSVETSAVSDQQRGSDTESCNSSMR